VPSFLPSVQPSVSPSEAPSLLPTIEPSPPLDSTPTQIFIVLDSDISALDKNSGYSSLYQGIAAAASVLVSAVSDLEILPASVLISVRVPAFAATKLVQDFDSGLFTTISGLQILSVTKGRPTLSPMVSLAAAPPPHGDFQPVYVAVDNQLTNANLRSIRAVLVAQAHLNVDAVACVISFTDGIVKADVYSEKIVFADDNPFGPKIADRHAHSVSFALPQSAVSEAFSTVEQRSETRRTLQAIVSSISVLDVSLQPPTLRPTSQPSRVPTLVPTSAPCDTSNPPLFGEKGDCPAELPSGGTCTPRCKVQGYTLSGSTSCNDGTLTAAVCQAAGCDASYPPRNGASGTCRSRLASGDTCVPSCNEGFKVSGTTRCEAGLLSAATCVRPSTGCGKVSSPPGCFRTGGSCEECCSDEQGKRGCWDPAAGVTFAACCSSCLNQAPLNGQLGEGCPPILADQATCVPRCNAGYQLAGMTGCASGILSRALCVRLEVCAVVTALNIMRQAVPNSTIADPLMSAQVQITESSLHSVPSLTIISSSSGVAQQLQAGSRSVYMGVGTLLKVGVYDTALIIGTQECVDAMPALDVVCSAGHAWDGRQCVRAHELSVCGKSAISLAYETRNSSFADASRALIGSALTFQLPEDHLRACDVQLVPVPKAAQSFPARTRAQLLRIGDYTLRGECRTRVPCIFSEYGRLRFVCPPTHRQVGRLCKPQENKTCSGSFVRLTNDDHSPCKRLPLLTISTESSTYIVAQKTKDNQTQGTTLSAKLVSGDFDVDWAADCPDDVEWLECARSTGHLAPRSPVGEMTLRLITQGQPDYSCGEDRKVKLPLLSQAKGLPNGTTYDGQKTLLPLTVRFISVPYLSEVDVSIFSISTGLVRSRTKYARDSSSSATVCSRGSCSASAGAFLLPWSNQVEIEIALYDSDRLPIKRPVGLLVTLPGEEGGVDNFVGFQQIEGSNVFSASLPNTWWAYGAVRYRIEIKTDSTESPVRLEIEFETSTVVKVAIAATLGAGLVILVFVLVRMVLRAGDKTAAKKILLSFLQFELFLGLEVAVELWDVCSDSMVLIAIEGDDVASSLRFGYRTCFGLASVASAIAISVKVNLLVRKVRERNRSLKTRKTRGSKHTAHEDLADEIKLEIRAIYCCVLIGACEDLPLGTLNLLYLRLYIINATPSRVQSLTGALLTMVSFASTFLLLGYKVACIADLPAWWAREKLLTKSTVLSNCFLEQFPQRRLSRVFNAWRTAVASRKGACKERESGEASDEESNVAAECPAIVQQPEEEPDEAFQLYPVILPETHPLLAIAPSGNGPKAEPTAMQASISDQIEDELECLICHDLLLSPVTTVCGHSFCSKCLASCFDRCGPSCPVCRAELTPTLPMVNIVLERLLGLHRDARQDTSTQPNASGFIHPHVSSVWNCGHRPTRLADSEIAPPQEVAPTTVLSLLWDESVSKAVVSLQVQPDADVVYLAHQHALDTVRSEPADLAWI
jgi:hypothetical protein